MTITKGAMAEMTLGIFAISEAIDIAFGETSQRFRDASKTPDELQFSRLDELKELDCPDWLRDAISKLV